MFLLVQGDGAYLKPTGKHCAKVMVRVPASPYVDHVTGLPEGVASYLLRLRLTFGKVMVWSKPSPLSTPVFIHLPNRRLWSTTKLSPFEPARYHF